MYSKHLGQNCTEREREAQAVRSEDLLAAFKDRKGVDLKGVVITGDLKLNELPTVPMSDVESLPPRVRASIPSNQSGQVRVIAGPILIRDSQMRGTFLTRMKQGLLVVTGPVSITGTVFDRTMDLSRTVFLGPVDFSDSLFKQECFFVQSQFLEPARFEQTTFGRRTRFHKAKFQEAVTFLGAGFSGMGEFLEVSFDKDANFSQTSFKLGSGFSGTRFRGALDFSEALFEREAFFLYTIFEKDAYFSGTTFRGQADFSRAEFRGVEDFSKVLFEKEPRFQGTKGGRNRPSPFGLQDPMILYGIGAALLIFTLMYVFVLRRR